MLAQNFKTAEDLGLSEAQRDALIKTLVLMETGKLKLAEPRFRMKEIFPKFSGLFNMNQWSGQDYCGTVACIGGTAELIGNVKFSEGDLEDSALFSLFYPVEVMKNWDEIIIDEAATALRSYLTIGHANWKEAVR